MNFMNMSTGNFEASGMCNFLGRSTSSFLPPFPPSKERVSSLFTPSFKNRFIACSPRFGTRIICTAQSFKRIDDLKVEGKESSFNIEAYMLERRNSIDKALELAIPLREPTKIHEAMRYSTLAYSKRVIPIHCIAACELVGGTESTAMPTACAMEMLCTMHFLIDDLPCMDNGDLRRRKPANHKVFGEHTTILGAVSLQALAYDHIAKATKGASPTNILRVVSEFATLIGAEGVAGGQLADKDAEGKSGIGLKQVEYIALHKTVPLFEAATVAGAVLGGASEEEINRLRSYSKYMGLFYQVVDDLLDVTKSQEELGKPAGKDMLADKTTYPRLFGVEKSRELAEKLIREAQDQLVGFDPEKAQPLKAMLAYVYESQK